MLLERILDNKHKEVAHLRSRGVSRPGPSSRDFMAALGRRHPAIVAEMKARSPSEGVISSHYYPDTIARTYERGGADALSVLTDQRFFGGSFSHLQAARSACTLPVLCKDFIIDHCQISEARAYGADACLLIVRILEDHQLHTLYKACQALGMTALVEVFNEQDLERALALEPELVGINNRCLDTLQVDRDNAARLQPLIPADVLTLSLSGVKQPADIRRTARGFTGILIGTALMHSTDPAEFLRLARS